MKIYFVADIFENCKKNIDTLLGVFPYGEITVFAPQDKQQEFLHLKIKQNTVFYQKSWAAMDNLLRQSALEDDTLICYASANFDKKLLLEVDKKSYENDIVYVRTRKINIIDKVLRFFYNVFVRLFIGEKDSLASSKIIFLSAKATFKFKTTSLRFKTIFQEKLLSDTVLYEKEVIPVKIKKPYSKARLINAIILLSFFVCFFMLDTFLTLPFLVRFMCNAIFVFLIFSQFAYICHNILENRSNGL